MSKSNSPWCDIHETLSREDCQQAANEALKRALTDLNNRLGNNPKHWQWGNAHQAVSEHRPFKNLPFLSKLFNVRVPFPGDAFTVNVGRPVLNNLTAPFETNHAPSLRAIYDLHDPEQSVFMLPTGQSGWVQNSGYRNLSQSWANNDAIPLRMTPKQIKRTIELRAK